MWSFLKPIFFVCIGYLIVLLGYLVWEPFFEKDFTELAKSILTLEFWTLSLNYPTKSTIVGLLVVYGMGGATVSFSNKIWRQFWGEVKTNLGGKLVSLKSKLGDKVFYIATYSSLLTVAILIIMAFQPDLHKFFGALIWPATIFYFIYLFKDEIGKKLSEAKSVSLAGNTAEFEKKMEKGFQSLHDDLKRTITTFSELIDRLCILIRETPPDQTIRFLAYTPALGYLARPESEWFKLEQLLREKSHKIQFTCLNKDQLEKWHDLFVGRNTRRGEINSNMTQSASTCSEQILAEMVSRCPPKRKRWESLPGYYLFSNEDRAIVVAPLFLPSIVRPLKRFGSTVNSVEMLGFETADRRVNEMVNIVYDAYYDGDNED